MKTRSIKERRESRLAIALAAPAAILLFGVMVVPLGWGISMSFTDKIIGKDANFIGLGNYIYLLTNPEFYNALFNTLVFTVLSISSKVVLGITMAMLLNMKFKGRNLTRAVLIIPWTLPNIVAVLNWKWIFAGPGGILNYALRSVGLIEQNIAWTGTATFAMMTVIIANVWRGTPFFGLTLLSKLQSIPQDMYEAVDIDGGNAFHKFWYITLPSLKDTLLLTTLVSTIWTLNEFDTVWLMTGGGPLNKTELLSIFSYKTSILKMQLGRAIGVSVLLMPFLILLISKITKLTERERG